MLPSCLRPLSWCECVQVVLHKQERLLPSLKKNLNIKRHSNAEQMVEMQFNTIPIIFTQNIFIQK